jgi:2-oxo-hept-3-ene-1,7-dioate hydratase
MTLSQEDVETIAQQLEQAEQSQTQIGHVSKQFSGMDMSDAYAIQRAWVALKLASSQRLVGWKIGLTSRAMQRSAGISEPDYGQLLDSMIVQSGARLDSNKFIVPRLETELAFQLKSSLQGPNCTLTDVLSATDWVMPALELIDARIEIEDAETGARRQVLDTVSDNAANAAVILGGRPMRPDSLDLSRVSATLNRNEVIEDSGVAAAVLTHPAQGVAWLANKIAAHGEKLEAGALVLSGSFTSPVAVRSGDVFYANYGELGVVSVGFD